MGGKRAKETSELFLQTLNNNNKPIDQQSDCWSTEAFASDSETQSEDGSNLLRLASQYHTASSSIGTDPLGNSTQLSKTLVISSVF